MTEQFFIQSISRTDQRTSLVYLMKSKTAPTGTAVRRKTGGPDTIASYERAQIPPHAAICRALRKEIEAALPRATSKFWHAMPVWFVGENPVVGYKATPRHVNLLFWNGQSFNEPALKAAGKFQAAQIHFTDVDQIDLPPLLRWIKKAGTQVWDYAGMQEGRQRLYKSRRIQL